MIKLLLKYYIADFAITELFNNFTGSFSQVPHDVFVFKSPSFWCVRENDLSLPRWIWSVSYTIVSKEGIRYEIFER
jgi:hypothetical protein